MNNLFHQKRLLVAALTVAALAGVVLGYSPILGFVLLGGLLVFIFSILWPRGILYASIASMVVGQLVRLPLFGEDSALLLNDLLLPMLFMAWLIRGIITKTIQIPRSSIWLPLGGVVLTMLLTGVMHFNAYDRAEWVSGMLYFIRWIEYLAVFFVVYDLSRITKHQRRILWWLIGSVVIVAGLGFIQLRVFPDFTFMVPKGWDPHIGRLLSTWFDPNFLGGWIAMAAGITLAFALLRPSRNMGWWTIFFILTIAELLTYSRSGYLGFVVAVAVVTSVRSRALLFIGTLVVLSAIAFIPRVQERVLGIRSVDQTAQFRIISWHNALDVVSDQPWFGVGYNHYKFVQEQRGYVEKTSEHSASGSDSSFLTILVTTGIVGLVWYLWLYGTICWEFIRTIRAPHVSAQGKALALGSVAAMLALAVHSQFVNSMLYPHIMETTWILLALTLRERNV